jgi:hypothetical protein
LSIEASSSKEAIGGFYLTWCESRDEPLELAAPVPQSPGPVVVAVLAVAAI